MLCIDIRLLFDTLLNPIALPVTQQCFAYQLSMKYPKYQNIQKCILNIMRHLIIYNVQCKTNNLQLYHSVKNLIINRRERQNMNIINGLLILSCFFISLFTNTKNINNSIVVNMKINNKNKNHF